MSLESKISILKDRAQMLSRARLFLSHLGLIEVDTPLLSRSAPIDLHIDIMKTAVTDRDMGYLHSSPEYAMKRLIASGLCDIFQISHVYRFAEEGSLHNPEFMMAEWYKSNITFDEIITDTLGFIQLFVSDLPHETLSYRALFLKYTDLDYLLASCDSLCNYIETNLSSYPKDIRGWDKDTILQYIVSFAIEPALAKDKLTVVTDFPKSQAALAKLEILGEEEVGKRFEIYLAGIELANGYLELTDPVEQRKRLILANQKRESLGKESLPIDEEFIKALEKGMPSCCGVAVGFDRLMMLRHHKAKIADVMPFSWQEL